MSVLIMFVAMVLSAVYELLFYCHSMRMNMEYMHRREVLEFYYDKYCEADELVRHLAQIMSV